MIQHTTQPGSSRAADKVALDLAALPRHHQVPPPQPGARFLAKIAAVGGDTLLVTLAEGETAVQVIKPLKVCPALDQAVTGYTINYTTTDKQTRTSTSGGNVETQTVVPRFIAGDLVEIGPVPGNVAAHAGSLAGITHQVINHPAYWSKQESS